MKLEKENIRIRIDDVSTQPVKIADTINDKLVATATFLDDSLSTDDNFFMYQLKVLFNKNYNGRIVSQPLTESFYNAMGKYKVDTETEFKDNYEGLSEIVDDIWFQELCAKKLAEQTLQVVNSSDSKFEIKYKTLTGFTVSSVEARYDRNSWDPEIEEIETNDTLLKEIEPSVKRVIKDEIEEEIARERYYRGR